MQSVSTNLNLQETRRHGSPDFPLEFNTDDTRDYYKNDINWHWHEEFELVYIIEGCVACHINQSVYELQPGEGIFINSSVLHRFTSEKYGIITNVIFLPAFLHLDYEYFSFFILTEDIEDSPPLILFQTEHLDVPECNVNDYFLLDNFIEETDDKIFAYFTAENLFPAVIRKGIDKFVHN